MLVVAQKFAGTAKFTLHSKIADAEQDSSVAEAKIIKILGKNARLNLKSRKDE